MSWSYAFSYGADNKIEFDKFPLVQLIGKNGHGKSSIALILEEVLFNKNSKGIKKTNVLNRYGAKKYTINLDFSVNDDDYSLETIRGTTQTVKLWKNKEDISAHTSTATYKLIEEIIGMDHKTFTQIVYQSSAFSLEFLTATDSNRKKFLIDLLSLERYTLLGDTFKIRTKDAANLVEVANMKQQTISSWLAKYSKENTKTLDVLPLPDPAAAHNAEIELPELQEQIATIGSTNKKIIQNNKYKEILASLDITPIPNPSIDIVSFRVVLKSYQDIEKTLTNTIKGIGPIITKCPECGQTIDSSHKEKMLAEAKIELPIAKENTKKAQEALDEALVKVNAYNKFIQVQQEWERNYSFIDRNLPEDIIDIKLLTDKKLLLESVLLAYNKEVKTINEANAKIVAHNAKVKVLIEQLNGMQEDNKILSAELSELNSKLTNLSILVKAFGTSGLVAYKIECLVKDLEELTNEYLQDMSDGRFQLGFNISSTDKLDVVITDNGSDIDIFALSNGELARVNISTLLAIRKLMQAISSTRINLLILDETVESLDTDGKERLVEVLLKEEYLNTILVSHGFSHPLLEKLTIVKDNNISRIE